MLIIHVRGRGHWAKKAILSIALLTEWIMCLFFRHSA